LTFSHKSKPDSYHKPTIVYHVQVSGLVQGVGFRPFVYRMAGIHQVNGWIRNTNDGVEMEIAATADKMEDFLDGIRTEAPAAAEIREILVTSTKMSESTFSDFRIISSRDTSEEITEVSPDIAVCDACLSDMKSQSHRLDYPFVNCTHCGPRFSIINDLPYDRAKTSMKVFPMCSQCEAEYQDIFDRRFHAQPVACNHCGPVYELITGSTITKDLPEIVRAAVKMLEQGKVVAMKGLGGFHLACDPFNEKAVRLLRRRKRRDQKPFALMFRDLKILKEYVELDVESLQSITSWRRPIILARQKREPKGKPLSPALNKGLSDLGVMLPYLPFHYLLFKELSLPALVMTSGNISDDPIMIDNSEALHTFDGIADAVLVHNRRIVNRTDDSIVRIMGGIERVIRRSRGFVPSPVMTRLPVEGIFAAGAELANCFCMGKGNKAILSQHIGDIKNPATFEFYLESVERFSKLFRFSPTCLVHDLHPEYLSSRYAMDYINKVTCISVQHHHAHIASCMAEHGLNEEVIGVAMDGLGLGDDGNIWGAEFFIADLEKYTRYAHFDYVPMPGGDKASEEPWRMAVSWLHHTYGKRWKDLEIPFIRNLSGEKKAFLETMLDNRVNSPLASSAGRLFDAIAALTGVCQGNGYQAEAPMKLEAIAHAQETAKYDYTIGESIDLRPMIRGVLEDIDRKTPVSIISSKFHSSVVSIIFDTVMNLGKESGLKKVVLSGGSFQNRILLENAMACLEKKGFRVFAHEKIPSNDGGIAMGQLLIAAKKLKRCV